jgi:Na+/citrate or Na+/malate symporter
MAKSKVVPDYKLEHTNKELDGRLTSLLLLARFFFSALILLHDHVHLPNVLVHMLVLACGLNMLKGHPMMYHGACMVRLTRLPPSKHVLMLSTPLILKIKKINSELAMSSNINLDKFLKH